jgi:uncharacterized protein YlbG (UPF0298 family)
MSEPQCHFWHRNFSSGQQCVHCNYQEPNLDDYKSDLRREFDRLLDRFANVTEDGKFKMIYIDTEELDSLKSELYDMDMIDFVQELANKVNPNLKK